MATLLTKLHYVANVIRYGGGIRTRDAVDITDAITEIESLTTQRDALLAACRTAILIFDNCPPDFANGVTGPHGYPDEGEVKGWALVQEIRDAIALCPPPCEKEAEKTE